MRIAMIAAMCASAFGIAATAPPFQMQVLNGRTVSFGQYRGKVLAVAFILTTCPHCQDLTKALKPLSREYAPRGVQFLECAFNEDAPATMPEFLDQFHPPFPVGWSSGAAVRAYLHYSTLEANFFVPHMVFLDRTGVVRGDFPGDSDFFKKPEENIRGQLEKMLKGSR
ncbi:Redoxin domain protein [Candidatus Sulfopaludibacter sp. SbA3]|nr:Redoxin domain protein [Candidatus Sulfopaludibacter sp. SbA3]